MTLESIVRVKRGFHSGRIGVIKAICENVEYFVEFESKGYWINYFDLEDVGENGTS